MHSLPDSQLLSDNVSYRKLWNYQFHIINRNGNIAKPKKDFAIAKDSPLMAVINGQLALLPLDAYASSDEMPYALAYSFYPSRYVNNEHYSVVGQFYGFSILTLPEHDWKRALRLQDSNPSESLLYSDRCLMSLLERDEIQITKPLEKSLSMFDKLRNLYIDQYDTHEGILAAKRAMEQALKCKTLMQEQLEGFKNV